MTRAFLDTNILVYSYTTGDARASRAEDLLHKGGAVSVQCLNEFAHVARRKLAMSWEDINEALSIIVELCRPVIPLDITVHRRGLMIAKEYQLSVYDGFIVSAAVEAKCETLYSEDMHSGLLIDGCLRVVNPFA